MSDACGCCNDRAPIIKTFPTTIGQVCFYIHLTWTSNIRIHKQYASEISGLTLSSAATALISFTATLGFALLFWKKEAGVWEGSEDEKTYFLYHNYIDSIYQPNFIITLIQSNHSMHMILCT